MKPFTVIDVAQGSTEWLAARAGKLTGSVASDMLATVKSGESAARRNLRINLALERLTGKPTESDGYVSAAMKAGIEREQMARDAYEALTGDLVTQTGFLLSTAHQAGCSLDGHLGDFDVLLSIKCRQPAAHKEALKGYVPKSALDQMRHELWITGAREHHYFSFNPDFPEGGQSRLVVLTLKQADVAGYEREALKFLAEVDIEVNELRTLCNVGAVLREVLA